MDNPASDEENRLTKVLADDLDSGQRSSLVEFLTAMSTGQFVLHGKSVEVTGLSSRRVKFLLRKFLYVNHLSGYGVLDTAGSFEIVHIKPETREEKEEHETLRHSNQNSQSSIKCSLPNLPVRQLGK